ncbi:hypothetical protein [Tunturiibacter psychrotolerans]|uniref:hypothetical protein n=1 Tax=Tunturiibacter psychrotolerans TaxID=3069686 RepID=UPI003D21953F
MILTGCGVEWPFVPTSVAQYRAYGDSITHGFTLDDPATQSYPNLVAKYEHVTLANNALSANQACDVPTLQIFPNQDSPTLATHPTYSLLIGTNDVTFKGVGPYEAVFELCHQATISWFALPAESKVLAGGTVGVTTTGPGAIDTTNNWNSWTTGGLGSTVSFAITTSYAGPIYAWPRIDDDNPATYSYSVDGVVVGTGSVQTTPRIATSAAHTTNSLSFLRLPSVRAGKHVVTFTQTSAGANGVSVVGIGTPTGPSANSLPTVLVGTIPFHIQNPTDPCNFPKGTCQVYIEDIEADVNLFSADGLNVRLFDTRKYMFGTPAEMNDMLHPNRLGQMELSRSVEALW